MALLKKGQRNELNQLKMKNRIRKYRNAAKNKRSTHRLKNHATLCSCSICSHEKYNRAKVKNSHKKNGGW